MGEIDVGLVEDNNAVPSWVGEDLPYVDLGEGGARRVTGRGEVGELDGGVVGKGVIDGRDIEGKGRRRQERHFYNADVVDLCRDSIHAVRWRTRQDTVFSRIAEASYQSVNGFDTANANKDVVR